VTGIRKVWSRLSLQAKIFVYSVALVAGLVGSVLFFSYQRASRLAEQSLEQLSPYDLNVIELKFMLPKGKSVEAEGKIAHRKMDGDQVGIGIEFTQIKPEGRKEINRFLSQIPNF